MSPASSSVETLYADHHGWLQGWLRRRIGHAGDAADLAHDTFLRVLGRPQGLLDAREPRAWLATVAHGLVVDQARRRRLEQACLQALAALPDAAAPSPEARLLLVETLVCIDTLLDGLGTKARQAFLMSRLDGLGYAEIATALGVSLSSVEKYMARAIRHCLALQQTLR